MTAAAARVPHYRPEGDLYDQLPRLIWTLDPTDQRSASLVCSVIINADRRGELVGDRAELLTNREIQRRIEAETGRRYSISFIKKGLRALSRVLGKKGKAIIERVRQHGRRIIKLIRGLRMSGAGRQPGAGEPIIPPLTPPEEIHSTMTTEAGSSSSKNFSPEKTGDPDPDVVQPLYELAKKVVDGVSFGAVNTAVKVFEADWVRKALKFMEKRNRKPGNVRKDWAYVLGILQKWKERGDAPDDDPEPKPQPVKKPPVDPSEEAQDKRIREAWGLLSEPEREVFRAEIRAEFPTLARKPETLEAFARGRFAGRMASEEPRAP